jgi:hypothetical protein
MSEPVFSDSFVRYAVFWVLGLLAARWFLIEPIIKAIKHE